MGDQARRNGHFQPTCMPNPKRLKMKENEHEQENVRSAVCDTDFTFHLFDPQNGVPTNTDELINKPKCIFLYKNTLFPNNVRVNKITTEEEEEKEGEEGEVKTKNNTAKIVNSIQNHKNMSNIYNLTSDDLLINNNNYNNDGDVGDLFVDLDCVPYRHFATKQVGNHIQGLCEKIKGLMESCKNDSQKGFYICIADLHKALEMAAATTTDDETPQQIPMPNNIRILVKQVLNLHTFNHINKDIFVLISLPITLMHEYYNPYNISGTIKNMAENSVGWLKFLHATTHEALKTAPETQMEQIYKQATHIICLEEQFVVVADTAATKSKMFALSTLNLQGIQSMFYKCLSRGNLFNLTEMIQATHQIQINNQHTKTTLNEFVFLSGLIPQTHFSFLLDNNRKTPSGALSELKKTPEHKESTVQQQQQQFDYNMFFMIKDMDAAMATALMVEKVQQFMDNQSSTLSSYAPVTATDKLSYYKNKVICSINNKWFQVYTFVNLTDSDPKEAVLLTRTDNRVFMYKTNEFMQHVDDADTCAEDDETDASRKITLNVEMAFFLKAINFSNTDSIKPTVRFETLEAFDAFLN